jgi:uncharacterized protein
MLRASSYTIYVTLPENDREMLLVHGYTGAFDRVARSVGTYVHSLEAGQRVAPLHGEWVTEPAAQRKGPAVPPPSEGTIATLAKRGYLTEMSPDEEVGYFARVVKKLHLAAAHRAPTYIFMPTYNCNLRCAYCFQDHMRSDPAFRHLLRLVSPEMLDRIVAAIPTLEQTHGIEPGTQFERDVGFFGGEPLLAANRPAIEGIVRRMRSIGQVRFWAVSNATELEAYEDLLSPEGIAEVQITMDGPPAEHDRRRIYADGSGSFEKIARNVELCLDRDVAVSMRMNIDRANVDQLPQLARTIVERGWNQRKGFSAWCSSARSISARGSWTRLSTTCGSIIPRWR